LGAVIFFFINTNTKAGIIAKSNPPTTRATNLKQKGEDLSHNNCSRETNLIFSISILTVCIGCGRMIS